MSPLRQSLEDYLRLRRAMGFKLKDTGEQLERFVEYADGHGKQKVTIDLAVAWATEPAGAQPTWWASRLSMVRGFARYLQTTDPTVQVPPCGLLRPAHKRATPYLYSREEIAALIHAASELRSPLRAATYQTLTGLLAATGMRVGEAIAADRDDLDLDNGMLLVRWGKFGKARELPLHPTCIEALEGYLKRRDWLHKGACAPALFISIAGTRLIYKNVQRVFLHDMVRRAGLAPRSVSCRPRLHDLRHSFAVRTLLDWYRTGADVEQKLPLLSTYLGHVSPSDTYWYLSAAPELLELAAQRLERYLERPQA